MDSAQRDCPPESLVAAREMTHRAVQPVTRAARANIPAVPDESHTNMAWDNTRGAFWCNPIAADGGAIAVGLALTSLTLMVARGDRILAQLSLPGVSIGGGDDWLDAELSALGLKKPSTVSHPYDLPEGAAAIGTYATDGMEKQLAALAAWFVLADSVLRSFAADHAGIRPGPGPVRCWAHHYDIATYVGLEDGHLESARAIGVGLSPGDGSYEQPYFYVNPWPRPDASRLPTLPGLGHWHTQGFVGAVLTATELLAAPDIADGATGFLATAFAIGRSQLGA